MIERREGLDVASLQTIDEAIVEIEALFVDRAGALRNDARPGDGEAVGFDAEAFDQVEVFIEPVIVIAGDIAVVTLIDPARHVGEGIPYGRLAAVGLGRTLDLEGGSCNAEDEIAGETRGKDFWIDHENLRSTFVRAAACIR